MADCCCHVDNSFFTSDCYLLCTQMLLSIIRVREAFGIPGKPWQAASLGGGHNILELTKGVTFFNSGFKSDPTELFPSIVLVIVGEKRFPLPNFNLKIMRIQRGSRSWMLMDAILHC
jgi:hypothetical protein